MFEIYPWLVLDGIQNDFLKSLKFSIIESVAPLYVYTKIILERS